MTIAYDYAQALLDLGRGYETSFKLKPSEGDVLGIAMTPSVIRDGQIKSHIIVNGCLIEALEDETNELFGLALHTLAHECAHVEVTHSFDHSFPGVLLQQQHENLHQGYRSQVILACWDEYAATQLSAGIGSDPTDGYAETLIKALAQARPRTLEAIRSYRWHGNIGRLLAEVYETNGNLLKYTSYLLGDLAGRGCTASDREDVTAALDGHWFKPYFERLDACLGQISRDFWQWNSFRDFELIADIVDQIIDGYGVHITPRSGGEIYVDVPLTLETLAGLKPPS